ncbi:hypothetical protein HMSSN139_19410 [Paenibacillus sp. HMSSN-139]|nr:hypothetical protein HMSSN139_19410 [Paenibacillus sp. HMSSN-139]
MRPTYEDALLVERMELAQEGIVIVVMTVDRKTRQILAGPDIVSRGFVYMQDARPLLRRAEAMLKRSLNRLGEKESYDQKRLAAGDPATAAAIFFQRSGPNPAYHAVHPGSLAPVGSFSSYWEVPFLIDRLFIFPYNV